MKPCFGLMLLLFVACNNPSTIPIPPPPDSTLKTSDTSVAVQETTYEETDSPTSFVPGYYTGLLPCTDCLNISRRILFLQDHSFHMMDTYNGKQVAPVEITGLWQTTNDHLQLLVNNTVTRRFMITNKGLKEVSVTGTPVAIYSDVYITHKMIGGDNAAWMEKKAAGIDFFALGTEPFWLMEIDKEKQISFLQVENNQTTFFPYVAPTPQNGQWVYTIQNDSTKLQIVITPQFCSDGMSDNWYEYKVEANFNGTMYSGCGVRLNESLNFVQDR